VRSLLTALDQQEAALRAAARANAETQFAPEVVTAQLLAQIRSVVAATPSASTLSSAAAPSEVQTAPRGTA
jgi:hypothetical protein